MPTACSAAQLLASPPRCRSLDRPNITLHPITVRPRRMASPSISTLPRAPWRTAAWPTLMATCCLCRSRRAQQGPAGGPTAGDVLAAFYAPAYLCKCPCRWTQPSPFAQQQDHKNSPHATSQGRAAAYHRVWVDAAGSRRGGRGAAWHALQRGTGGWIRTRLRAGGPLADCSSLTEIHNAARWLPPCTEHERAGAPECATACLACVPPAGLPKPLLRNAPKVAAHLSCRSFQATLNSPILAQ